MASTTTVKTIGTTGTFSTPQLWEDGSPANLTTAERSACGTFAVATFVQGEALTFVGSGATGVMLDTDSTGIGTGTYMTYGITLGNPAAADVITGTSTATCILTSGTPDFTGVIWQGQCQNQEFTSAASILVIQGSVSSGTAYKELTTVGGASFRDHVNVQSNPLRYNASVGAAIRKTSGAGVAVNAVEDFFRCSNMQIANDEITGSGGAGIEFGAGCIVDFLICESFWTGIAGIGPLMTVTGSSTIVRNSVIVNRASGAPHIGTVEFATVQFYNCTFVCPDDVATAPTVVIQANSGGTITMRNCALFAGDSTKAIRNGTSTFNFTTCYSDISGTAGVTQTTYANEFQNVNDATRDFRLKTGAAQIDTGTTDTTNAAIDIAKTNRPSGAAYDVGAWEFVQAGGGPTLMAQRMR